MAKRSVTIKDIVQLKQENERLQQIVNLLRIENSDYAMKCNRIENIISKMDAVFKDNPAKLVEASGNVFSILQNCATSRSAVKQAPTINNESPPERRNSVKSRQNTEKARSSNKAHIKPHMVNGHILFVPTINLTRVSDSHIRTSREVGPDQTENNILEENSNGGDGSDNLSSATEESEAVDEARESTINHQLHSNEDISEPSTSQSPSHSTVLSGTFKEVKIYLSPVTPDSLDDSTKFKNKTSKARTTKFGRITRSKRS